MAKYRVLLNGRNYWLNVDGQPECMGFYTWRYVEASAPEHAADLAIDLIRGEHDLNSAILNPASDTPMIYIEGVDELESFGEVTPPGKGRTWYRERDTDEDDTEKFTEK